MKHLQAEQFLFLMMNRILHKLALIFIVTMANAQSFNNLVESMAGASEHTMSVAMAS